ncbi:hypothetical protein ABIA31_008493 [Catenulispora sp. MAP5-51]|uniref:tyrosine-type recombinase/integrase n=1 Tax=Catenulispora sp. MAP5-51 TaxID=3156298 RepID=UPI003516F2FB
MAIELEDPMCAQDLADRGCGHAVSESAQLALDPHRTQVRFSRAMVTISSTSSSLIGGRPGGLGWRHLFATGLRATSFDPAERSFRVTVQVQEVEGPQTEEPPKRGKTRTVIFPHTTPGGYALEEAVRLRVDEVQCELRAGINPRGLMFPGDRGGWIRRSHLNDRVVKPAYVKAGWRGDQTGGEWTWHTLRHVFCTTALTDWRFSLTLVAQLAGHANTKITSERYVNPAAGVLERALAAIRNTATGFDGHWGDAA